MVASADLSEKVRQCAEHIAENGAAALAGLYDLTAVRLTRLAVAITRNQHDAEDAVQATLIKVLANHASLLHSKTPWPYLLSMVRNEALVILRKRKNWSLVDGLSDLITRQHIDSLEQEDAMKAVWAALRRLPTDQCEVVVLKIWEEMTFADIGSTLGIPATTAASRYRYAMQKLEQMLKSIELGVTK